MIPEIQSSEEFHTTSQSSTGIDSAILEQETAGNLFLVQQTAGNLFLQSPHQCVEFCILKNKFGTVPLHNVSFKQKNV